VGRRRQQSLFIVGAAALSILTAPGAFAQGSRHSHNNGAAHPGRSFQHAPERMLHLSPEDQQTFRRNAERWLQMDPQQRQVLRQREVVRQQRMKAEAEAALRDSGLSLENGARQQFEERYLQERRRIERNLGQEIEAKRQQELPQLKERLKSEFQTHQPSPGPSGKP
jgi:hypothetical protein